MKSTWKLTQKPPIISKQCRDNSKMMRTIKGLPLHATKRQCLLFARLYGLWSIQAVQVVSKDPKEGDMVTFAFKWALDETERLTKGHTRAFETHEDLVHYVLYQHQF